MKKLSLLLVALMAIAFASCEKESTITLNLTWDDVEYFDLSGEAWKAALYDEAISFIKDEHYNKSALETIDVTFEAASVAFTASFSSYQNFTAVVFADLNENGKYDMGENAAVEFTGFDPGEAGSFDLSVNY